MKKFILCPGCTKYSDPDTEICPFCGNPLKKETVDPDTSLVSTLSSLEKTRPPLPKKPAITQENQEFLDSSPVFFEFSELHFIPRFIALCFLAMILFMLVTSLIAKQYGVTLLAVGYFVNLFGSAYFMAGYLAPRIEGNISIAFTFGLIFGVVGLILYSCYYLIVRRQRKRKMDSARTA